MAASPTRRFAFVGCPYTSGRFGALVSEPIAAPPPGLETNSPRGSTRPGVIQPDAVGRIGGGGRASGEDGGLSDSQNPAQAIANEALGTPADRTPAARNRLQVGTRRCRDLRQGISPLLPRELAMARKQESIRSMKATSLTEGIVSHPGTNLKGAAGVCPRRDSDPQPSP